MRDGVPEIGAEVAIERTVTVTPANQQAGFNRRSFWKGAEVRHCLPHQAKS